jgi:phenylpyruvate tautomerase PptA (4-oxalocrotonate tautomerase family)
VPYLSIQTNLILSSEQSRKILQKASQLVSQILGKPESYVMVAIQDASKMSFGGNTDPLAYLELKSLGLPENSTVDFSRSLCSLLHTELGIEPARIYIEFAGPERHMWGWDSETF